MACELLPFPTIRPLPTHNPAYALTSGACMERWRTYLAALHLMATAVPPVKDPAGAPLLVGVHIRRAHARGQLREFIAVHFSNPNRATPRSPFWVELGMRAWRDPGWQPARAVRVPLHPDRHLRCRATTPLPSLPSDT